MCLHDFWKHVCDVCVLACRDADIHLCQCWLAFMYVIFHSLRMPSHKQTQNVPELEASLNLWEKGQGCMRKEHGRGVRLWAPLNYPAQLNIKFVCCIPSCLCSMQISCVCVFLLVWEWGRGLWESEGANPKCFAREKKTIQSVPCSLNHHHPPPNTTATTTTTNRMPLHKTRMWCFLLCVEVTPRIHTQTL